MLNTKQFLTIIISVLFLFSLLILSSCAPDSDLGVYINPDTYTTYQDKNGLFSISYPVNWTKQEPFSRFEEESDSLNKHLKGIKYTIDTNFPDHPNIKNHWLLFMANNNTTGNVIVSAWSIADSFLKGKTREQIYNTALETKDYKTCLQETLKIAGHEVAIFKVPPDVEVSNLVSVTITDNLVWSAVCWRDDEQDLQIIVKSLRILR